MEMHGSVTLVGAGPGDPGLLTIAGREALETAEVVLFDRLVGDAVLAMIPARAEKIDVGKQKGRHPVPQEAINSLLLTHAMAGRRVVRLKGGDPYLFGRGAEELEAVSRAGILFSVIPGISSALAAPACAGIPVTHRDLSSSVHILTGHGKEGDEPEIPYSRLAGMGGTLIFLMALSTVETICRRLMEEGLAGDTPAAAVEHGSLPEQRRLTATVASLARRVEEEGFSSPAVLIIGAVCGLGDRLDPAARLPLHGRRILAASSRVTAGRLAAALRRYGCAVDEYAGIGMEPVRVPAWLMPELPSFAWLVFTSRYGVETFFAALAASGTDVRRLGGSAVAAVGGETADALAAHGIHADLVPGEFNGRRLGEELARLARPGDRVLLYRAADGASDLPDALRQGGMEVVDAAAYRTFSRPLPAAFKARLEAGGYDAVTFTSGSSVQALAASLAGAAVAGKTAYCLGERTARAAEALGFRAAVSPEATVEAMARMMAESLGGQT